MLFQSWLRLSRNRRAFLPRVLGYSHRHFQKQECACGGCFHLGNRAPVGIAFIHLCAGSPVNRNRSTAHVLQTLIFDNLDGIVIPTQTGFTVTGRWVCFTMASVSFTISGISLRIPAPAPLQTTFFTEPKLMSMISGLVASTISTERNMESMFAPKIWIPTGRSFS